MNKIKSKNHIVMIESRNQKIVSCPYCWTDQLSNRNFCYHCGAQFIYLDEAPVIEPFLKAEER